MSVQPSYELKFSHHVVEHLGLKLYQNKPTNVIAELVSNAWDANAGFVEISIHDVQDRSGRYIAVADNGCGMSPSDIAENYLVIGKPKRRKAGGRYSMGRKGIGKLAPFGIARTVDLISVTKKSVTWLRFRLPALLDESASAGPTSIATYTPEVIYEQPNAAALPNLPDPTGQIASFLKLIGPGTGTLILLSDLSLLRSVSPASIIEGMGRRFTVTLDRPDFKVSVNGDEIVRTQSLPEFDFRIPEGTGFTTEQIGDKEVKYWVGFVKTAAWPSDEAGVGVYAHGKIAQDRPFTFGVKGREIHTRYMYGVVEADFLDEMTDDVISTDRSSIDWDNPNCRPLYEWGGKHVRLWIEKYRDFRASDEARRVLQLVDQRIAAGELPKIRSDERRMISQLIAEVTPSLPKSDGSETAVTSAIMKAYLHLPTRQLLKNLWSTFSGDSKADGEAFLGLVNKLSEAAIPEALSIAVTFAERAYALSCLTEYQHEKGETAMQKLLERFPWILAPGYEKLVANQQLRTMVMEAQDRGLSPSRVDVSNPVDDTTKPDFVFLNTMEKEHIVVVEIKSPREDLTLENREQLNSYMTYIEQQYPHAKLEGILVGANGKGLEAKRSDMKIVGWDHILNESKRGHIDMLAALLRTANPEPDDARVSHIQEFGGKEVWDALERVAANDEALSNLLQDRK